MLLWHIRLRGRRITGHRWSALGYRKSLQSACVRGADGAGTQATGMVERSSLVGGRIPAFLS